MALTSRMIPNLAEKLQHDFSYLDELECRNKYAYGPGKNSMRFYVGGIRCSKCVRRLEDLASSLSGLLKFRVEMGKNLAHVEVDSNILPFSDVALHIVKLGFDPIPLTHETSDEEIVRSEDRSDLIRLGVAAACASNIMTFAIATYFGAGEWTTTFHWLSFALYLPVLTYVALPFYQGAYQSLKQRHLSIDLPMALASVAGFVISTIALVLDRSDIYFDSLSGFLFLILLARWFQKRLQRKLLRPQELNESLQLQRVRKMDNVSWAWTLVENIMPGDRFALYALETSPADAELLSSKAYFSLAWLSGEAKAKTFLRGSVVPAGARLLAGQAQLITRQPLSQTGFGQILEEVRKFSLSKNHMVLTADRWAQWLLGTVFVVAITFVVFYWQVSPEQALQRALALLILACPCAMAFGTPLALAVSLKRAQKAGIIIRDANIFEQAAKVETIFLDKTGTLTDANLHLIDDVDAIPSIYQKIVLSLENESLHPIAFSFRKAFTSHDRLPPVDDLIEIPGVGVSGYIFGKHYELRKNTLAENSISCTLFEDEKPVLRFHFAAQIKPDCLQTLTRLRENGHRVVLLSGDQEQSVRDLAETLHFSPEDVYFGKSPCDKASLVGSTTHSMMVGDGINDSLAIIRADVGIAVTGGMEAALKSADAYLTEEGVKGVADLIELSRQALDLIRQNLTVSIIYNIAGGTLALLGYVNPLVAAILMPVSSGFILLSTWLRSRQ